jgi:hypothetical protein
LGDQKLKWFYLSLAVEVMVEMVVVVVMEEGVVWEDTVVVEQQVIMVIALLQVLVVVVVEGVMEDLVAVVDLVVKEGRAETVVIVVLEACVFCRLQLPSSSYWLKQIAWLVNQVLEGMVVMVVLVVRGV